MRLRPKLFLALACLLPALPAPAARAQDPTAITEEKVLAAVTALDKARAARKLDVIAAYLADDFRYKVIGEIGESDHYVLYDRAKYLDRVRFSFSKIIPYEYKRHRTEVAISKDGQSAIVNSELFEKSGRDLTELNSILDEIYVFKLRGGKILLTSKYITLRIVVPPE